MKSKPTVTGEDRLAARWIVRMAEGEVEALNALYRLYHRPLLSIFNRILKDSQSAEEVLQDTYVRAFKKADRFNPEAGVAFAWLVTIGKRIAFDRLRRRRARPDMENWEQPEVIPDKELGRETEANLNDVEHSWIEAHLQLLPERQRQTLELAFFDGYTQHEISQLLDRPLGTVKSDLYRGLARLRETYLNKND
ncbi:MAG: RNA polymerase sigma factor [Opitutales bacterium]